MSSDTATVPAAWSDRLADLVPDRRTLAWAAILVNAEAIAVLAYISLPTVTPTAIRYYIYPLVWINVGLWALVRTWPAADRNAGRDGRNGANAQSRKRGWLGGGRKRYLASALAAGYFLVLAYVGGLIQIHALHGGHSHAFGLSVTWPLPPGWGPTLLVSGDVLGIAITPYKVLGYATLAYLVYVTVLETAGSLWASAVGLFSCVSCTWPVLGTVLAGTLGGSAAVVVFATEQPYAASTLVFLSAVSLLLWRPFDRGSANS